MKKLLKYPFRQIEQLFLWASGVEIDLLKQAPTDKSKYFGIGGTIVFTALMASFAGGYAFFVAFKEETLGTNGEVIGVTPESQILAIFFGIFWGALIFNLDRYIVSTFGVGDGKKTISRQELIEAAPRLVMAIILGIVISTPLELKIFEKEIQTAVQRLKIDEKNIMIQSDSLFYAQKFDYEVQLDTIESRLERLRENKNSLLQTSVSFIEERKKELTVDLKQKEEELNIAQARLNNKYNRYIVAKRDTTDRYTDLQIQSRRTNYLAAIGPRNTLREQKEKIQENITQLQKNKTKAIKKEKADIDAELSLLTTRRDNLLNKKNDLDNTSDRKAENYQNIADNYDGFAAHLEALSIITEDKPIIFYSKWLITFLFILIEIAPILFKMMTERGPYDDILDRVKHELKVKQLLMQSNINQEINTAVKVHADKNSQKLNAELASNKDLLESITKAQAEIAQVAIDAWKVEQMEKVRKNPSSMIKTNDVSG